MSSGKVTLPIHGDEHCPGGPDPIPCLGGPIVFRAAIQCCFDPAGGTDRVHYPSGGGEDSVYWDSWDTTFDTSVYDISDFDFTDPLTGRPSIAGVMLLKRGLYSIHAQIDIGQYLNGVTQLSSNYDNGQAVYAEHNMNSQAGDPFLSDFMGIRLDHWRQIMWVPDAADDPWGGSNNNVEIVFGQNNDSNVNYYGNVPGTVPLATPAAAPTPGSDVWIPGGLDGAWGFVPRLTVMYWGEPGWDVDWPDSVQVECPT